MLLFNALVLVFALLNLISARVLPSDYALGEDIGLTYDDEASLISHSAEDAHSYNKRANPVQRFYGPLMKKNGRIVLIPVDINKNHYFIGK